MTAYIGPQRFATMRTGADLTGLSDLEINEALEDATEMANAFCLAPIGPQPFSFLGGTVTGEQLPWRYPEAYGDKGSRRVYPSHQPVRTVDQFLLVVGSEASASIPVDTVVINNRDRWVELTAASIVNSSGLFGVAGWIVPFGGLMQPIAQLDYTYGWDFEVVGERIFRVSDGIYQAANGHWVSSTVTVKVDGSPVGSGFTLDTLEGRVIFGVDPTPGIVTLDYHHKLPRAIPSGTGQIAAALLGMADNVARGMIGLSRITDAEITLQRTPRSQAEDAENFVRSQVPQAAQLLDGYRFWSMA